MKVIDQNFAIGLGEVGEEVSDVFVGELADDELEVFEIFSDHLDLSDPHWSHLDELGQGADWVIGVK